MVILLPILAFVFGSLLVAAAAMAFAPERVSAIERRLGEVTGAPVKIDESESGGYSKAMVDGFRRLGAVAPRQQSEAGKLQQRLTAAGYRSNEALVIFYGIRLGVAFLAFLLLSTPIIVQPNILMALGGALPRLRHAGDGARPDGQSPAASHSPRPARRARPAGRERGSRPWPGSGHPARRPGAAVRSSGPLR